MPIDSISSYHPDVADLGRRSSRREATSGSRLSRSCFGGMDFFAILSLGAEIAWDEWEEKQEEELKKMGHPPRQRQPWTTLGESKLEEDAAS